MALVHKYRPKKFSDVIGQRSATGILIGMLKNGKLPPTILMTGPRGVGKTTCARILANSINCKKPKDNDPCMKCRSCKSKHHPDILELNCADKRGIDEMRNLRDVSRLVPQFKHRIFILDEVHALTHTSFDATLKMFEEPPETSTFILVTTNPEKLPNTILSRAQKLSFDKIDEKILAKYVFSLADKEAFTLSKKDALKIARASGGYARDAIHLLEQVISYSKSGNSNTLDLDNRVEEVIKESPINVVISFMAAFLNNDIEETYKIANKVDNYEYFMKMCVDLLRAAARRSISPSLVEPQMRWALKRVPNAKLQVVTSYLEIFVETFQNLKNYVVSAEVLLDLAIAKIASKER